jgi:hypothetical protein
MSNIIISEEFTINSNFKNYFLSSKRESTFNLDCFYKNNQFAYFAKSRETFIGFIIYMGIKKIAQSQRHLRSFS